MYAIRSYYDQPFTPNDIRLDHDTRMLIITGPNMGGNRITSYNVCYTKLLRPFIATGQTVEIAPKAKSVPTVQVSRDAGEYIHWSGDSHALHWSLGPELVITSYSIHYTKLYDRDPSKSFGWMPSAFASVSLDTTSYNFV